MTEVLITVAPGRRVRHPVTGEPLAEGVRHSVPDGIWVVRRRLDGDIEMVPPDAPDPAPEPAPEPAAAEDTARARKPR